MTPGLVLLLGVLATWRLARDFVYEEGPLGWYGRTRRMLRGWAEAQIEESDIDDPKAHPWYWLYEGVACMVCASFWAGLLVAVLVTLSLQPLPGLPGSTELAERLGGRMAIGLLIWFGLAGGSLITERLYTQWMVKHGPF